MPIGRGEGKWFVWQGLRVVGKVAGTCERVFGGWGFCGGAAVRYWKHGGLDAVMRGRRRRSPEGCSNVKDARVTVVRYSLSLSNLIPSRSIAGTEALLGTSVRA
jgi:hypothetical protein